MPKQTCNTPGKKRKVSSVEEHGVEEHDVQDRVVQNHSWEEVLQTIGQWSRPGQIEPLDINTTINLDSTPILFMVSFAVDKNGLPDYRPLDDCVEQVAHTLAQHGGFKFILHDKVGPTAAQKTTYNYVCAQDIQNSHHTQSKKTMTAYNQPLFNCRSKLHLTVFFEQRQLHLEMHHRYHSLYREEHGVANTAQLEGTTNPRGGGHENPQPTGQPATQATLPTAALESEIPIDKCLLDDARAAGYDDVDEFIEYKLEVNDFMEHAHDILDNFYSQYVEGNGEFVNSFMKKFYSFYSLAKEIKEIDKEPWKYRNGEAQRSLLAKMYDY